MTEPLAGMTEPGAEPWLREVVAQVRAVYPAGIPAEEVLTGIDRHIAYGAHVVAAARDAKRLRARVDEIHAALGEHGWDQDAP